MADKEVVKYVDQKGNEVKKPSLMKRRRYPITITVSVLLGIPAFLFIIAVIVGTAGISSKFVLVALVFFFYFAITGLCFIAEGEGKHHW